MNGKGSGAGFTLIEMLVALVLFALISIAGISFIETMIGIQHRTAGRMERLADIQRTMFLIDADFDQLAAGPDRAGDAVALTRGSAQGDHRVAWLLAADGLHRSVDGIDHLALAGVAAIGWRFWKPPVGWVAAPTSHEDARRPLLVEFTATLPPQPGMVGGQLRRVIALPARP